MKAKWIGKHYTNMKHRIKNCCEERERLTNQIELNRTLNISEKRNIQKQTFGLFIKRDVLKKEIEHYQLFVSLVERGLNEIKSQTTNQSYMWFYENNFNQQSQIDIAFSGEDEVSEKTVSRVVSQLNKTFIDQIELEVRAYFETDKTYREQLKSIYKQAKLVVN